MCGSTLPASIPVPDPTRTRGYGSGTGRCLTGRVGYGYEVHGSGIPVFLPVKNTIFHDVVATSNVIFICLFLANVNYMPSSVRLSSVCLSSVTFVHPTQAIEIFGNVSTPFSTLAICDPSVIILQRSSQGNPSVGGLNQRGVAM